MYPPHLTAVYDASSCSYTLVASLLSKSSPTPHPRMAEQRTQETLTMKVPSLIYLTTLAAALSLVSAQSDPRHGVGYDERFVEGVLTHTAGQWKKCIPYFR